MIESEDSRRPASDVGSAPDGAVRPEWPAHVDRLLVPFALAAITFLAYFRRLSRLGLHGDAQVVFGNVALRSWSAEWANTWFALTQWPQGRPLAHGLNLGIIPHFAFQIGGLTGWYIGAFVALVVTTVLLYTLVRRTYPAPVAFAGAAFYALSPVDSVQLSLLEAHNFEIAMAVAVAGAHAALSRRPVLFVVCLAATLTMNEPAAIFMLIAPPLLALHVGGARPARLLRHIALWIAVVLAVLLARWVIGDPWGAERVGEIISAPSEMFARGRRSAFVGFGTFGSLLVERLRLPLQEADGGIVATAVSCGLIALVALGWHFWRSCRAGAPAHTAQGPGPRAVTLMAAGVASMLAIYFTYFRPGWYPANHRTGPLSAVHALPAVGAALFVAGVMHAGLTWLPRRARWATLLAAAMGVGLLGGFGEILQREYEASWRFQQDFWRAYRRLCRDATERTFVLVPRHGLPKRRFIEDFSWASEFLPDLLFRYHEATMDSRPLRRPPVVIRVGRDPTAAIRREGARLRWWQPNYSMLAKGDDEQPEDGNVIVLEWRERQWSRIEGVVPVEGGTLALRPSGGDLLDRIPATRLAPVYMP